MSEGIAANYKENINRKNAENKRKTAPPSIVKALLYNSKYNRPNRYGQPKTKQQSFKQSIKHRRSKRYEDRRTRGKSTPDDDRLNVSQYFGLE